MFVLWFFCVVVVCCGCFFLFFYCCWFYLGLGFWGFFVWLVSLPHTMRERVDCAVEITFSIQNV